MLVPKCVGPGAPQGLASSLGSHRALSAHVSANMGVDVIKINF